MKCHANIGIKVGDIRGGVSASVPMEPIYAAFKSERQENNMFYGMIWLLGLCAIGYLAWRSQKEAGEVARYHAEIGQLNSELEQRVQRRTAQLETANKDLEGFSYSVSHDLRAPLRAIDGFSLILLEDYHDKLDDEGKRLLNVVRDNTKKMGQLIDDILQFSRAGRTELARVEINMGTLVQTVWQELAPTTRQIRFELGSLPDVCADRSALAQVMTNLLSNAIKFTVNRDQALIEVGGNTKDNETIYYVRDNGAGFDMQYVDKLFGVFQRLHGMDEFEGTGIGLAIVKRIISKHGGRLPMPNCAFVP